MSAPDDPGRFLLGHRAPEGLLERARERAARAPDRRWVGWAAAAAALLVGGVGGWTARGAALDAVIEAPPPAVLVASANQAVPVRLVLHAPQAASVSVAGTFNGWSAETVPLARGVDGVWHTTVRLPPGRYEYLFVIDGAEWVNDPSAPLSTPDDFGQANAILEV